MNIKRQQVELPRMCDTPPRHTITDSRLTHISTNTRIQTKLGKKRAILVSCVDLGSRLSYGGVIVRALSCGGKGPKDAEAE